VADLLCQILRMDRLLVVGLRQLVQTFARLAIVLNRAVEVAAIAFVRLFRQQRLQCALHIADIGLIDVTM